MTLSAASSPNQGTPLSPTPSLPLAPIPQPHHDPVRRLQPQPGHGRQQLCLEQHCQGPQAGGQRGQLQLQLVGLGVCVRLPVGWVWKVTVTHANPWDKGPWEGRDLGRVC